jgi:hypothetical protein
MGFTGSAGFRVVGATRLVRGTRLRGGSSVGRIRLSHVGSGPRRSVGTTSAAGVLLCPGDAAPGPARSGDVRHLDVDGHDLVDAHFVVREIERFVADLQAVGVADERTAHRAAAVVEDVVVPRQHVLAQLDVSREAGVGELLVGLRDGGVVGVVLRLLLAAVLLHREQQRE